MKRSIPFLMLVNLVFCVSAQEVEELFEDVQFERLEGPDSLIFFTSKDVDFIQIPSTISDSVRFAIVVYKPARPSRIVLVSHGWHMSAKPPRNSTNPFPGFLTIQVDMRGRKYSTGQQDCNGYELYDFFDAYRYALKHYAEYVLDADQVYFTGGSGGGGNGLGLLGKFPDLFCSAVIRAPVSDYKLWFEQDSLVSEFRDEMIPWIGGSPVEKPMAYMSRSGITTVSNVLTPTYIIHGNTDVRVPVSHSRNYVAAGTALGKPINYLELGNVGTRSHWGNITDTQQQIKDQAEKIGLMNHSPPVLPTSGELVVAGYVITKQFSVFLNSIDDVGRIKYDVNKEQVEFLKGAGRVEWIGK